MPFADLCVPCKSTMEKQIGQFKKVDEEVPYSGLPGIDTEEFEE